MQQELRVKFAQVSEILEAHERNPHKLIAILQEIQELYSYLPEDVMHYVATALGVPPGSVFGVATFYSHFTLEPKGNYVIKVCDGTACHVKKSADIIKTLEQELGLSESRRTTEDLVFTLETVACLGACGLAPVVVINDDVYGSMTPEKTIALLNEIKAKTGVNKNEGVATHG